MSSTTTDWYRSAPVQAALAAVGESDGTDEWVVDFAERLLAEVDRREAMDIEEMLSAVSAWQWHLQEHPQYLPPSIPRMLLTREVEGRTMDFESCAWLLSVSEAELERILWHSHEKLAREAQLVMSGQATPSQLRGGGNGGRQTLIEYLRLRHGWIAEDRSDAKLTKRHIEMIERWCAEEAINLKQARQRLIDLGEIPDTYRYDSLRKRVGRERRELRRASAVAA